MRTCQWCSKSGWFLKLTKDGLCPTCEADVKSRIIHATQVLNESMRLLKKSKDLDLRLSKSKVAIEKLRDLLPYFQKGLVRLKPSPQEWVMRIHSEQRKIVNQHIGTLMNDSIKRAQQSTNAAQRSAVFEVVQDGIHKYSEYLGKANAKRWQSKIEVEQGYLVKDLENSAKKKSERDIALDQYRETLAMMRAEFAGSREQVLEIRRIEKLITDLGGQLPEPLKKESDSNKSNADKEPSAASHKHQIIIPQKKTGTS